MSLKGEVWIDHRAHGDRETKVRTIAQLREFLDGTCEFRFERVDEDAKRYTLIESVLGRLGYQPWYVRASFVSGARVRTMRPEAI